MERGRIGQKKRVYWDVAELVAVGREREPAKNTTGGDIQAEGDTELASENNLKKKAGTLSLSKGVPGEQYIRKLA